MARLLTRTRTRLAVKRTATKQKSRFQTKKRTHLAGVIAGGLAVVDGQLYGTGADSAGVIDVVNLGRAAAALYVPENGSGSVTLAGGSGSCSDGGSGGVGVHALDGPYHTGTLAQSQAPWAALDSDLQDHIADDIHHERLHNILNTDDHEVTAARYSVLGTPNAANALAMWLTDEDGTPGNVLLRSDSDGNARLNALFAHERVQSASHYWGYGGSGYYLGFNPDPDLSARTILEVDDVSVRGRLTARELLIQKIRTTTGPIFVSSGGEAVTATDLGGGSWQLTFEEDHGFLEYDLIAAQAWTGAGVYRLEMTVTDVADTKTLTATLDNGWGDTPGSVLDAGLTLSLARHGNEVDPDRQGLIYLTSDEAGAPFIRVIDGIDSWAKWGDPSTIKMQMGQLEGVSHAVMGDLTGFGMVATGNAYMEGLVVSGNGDTVMGDDGLNIQAGTLSEAGWSNHSDKITFAEDPMATLDHGNVIAQIGAERFVSGSDVVRRIATRVNAGADSDTDQARIGLEAYWIDAEADVPIQYAAIQMIGEEGAPSIFIGVQGATSNAGTISLNTPVLNVSGHIRMTGGGDIGTALDPVGTLYADELVVGTTYTENTGYVNDTRYYPRTELNTYLANNFEPLGHSHPGLITSADLTDELAAYATIAYVDGEIAAIPAPDLSNYWTKPQADGRYTQATVYNAHVSGINPHGTTLASLTAKDYDDLTNRGHLLADAVGLGPDHTIGAAAVGHVLRATDTDKARFMQLAYGDLGSRTHDILSEHSITAAQYSVIGTPGAANTLAAWATTSDGSAGNKLLRSDSNGDLALNGLAVEEVTSAADLTIGATNLYIQDEEANTYWQIDSTGALRSQSPVYDGNSGALLTPAGYLDVQDGHYRGRLSTTVFEYRQQSLINGALIVGHGAGVLYEDLAFDAITNSVASYQLTVKIRYPQVGAFHIAEADDILILRSAIAVQAPDTGASFLAQIFEPVFPAGVSGDATIGPGEIQLKVLSRDDTGTYLEYTCLWQDSPTNSRRGTFPAGTAVANIGQPGVNGGITLRADDPQGVYIDIWKHQTPSPSTGIFDRRRGIIRLGEISTLTGVEDEIGLIGGADLTDPALASYFILSDQRRLLYNVPAISTNAAGDELRIDANGIVATTRVYSRAERIAAQHPEYDSTALAHYWLDDELFDTGELTWSTDASAPDADNTTLRLYSVRADMFEPYRDWDPDSETYGGWIEDGNAWTQTDIIESRASDEVATDAHSLEIRAMRHDGTVGVDHWRRASIRLSTYEDNAAIAIDATGNYASEGKISLRGDVYFTPGIDNILTMYAVNLPHSIDGVTIDGTQTALRRDQMYIDTLSQAICVALG